MIWMGSVYKDYNLLSLVVFVCVRIWIYRIPLVHLHQMCYMCQMPNIWHIWHTKHKKPSLSNVPNAIIFATCYSIFTYLPLYGQIWQMPLLFFYSSFSLISPLISLSQPNPLLSLTPILSSKPQPSLLFHADVDWLRQLIGWGSWWVTEDLVEAIRLGVGRGGFQLSCN